MLETTAVVELILCWGGWLLVFVTARMNAVDQKKAVSAHQARWGIALQMIGVALAWTTFRPQGFGHPPALLVVSMLLGPPSVALALVATHHLGKHWRLEAAILEDHELVQTGPYRWLRHPIYSSMLGMFLSTGAALCWWPLFILALIVFLMGTEIRVRTEDRLLAARFQEAFETYRLRVDAYIPFIR